MKSQWDLFPTLYRTYSNLPTHPELWEGMFRVACMFVDNPEEEASAKITRDFMSRQQADGSLGDDLLKAMYACRAALAIYEYDNDRTLLKGVTLWCGWVSTHWDAVSACAPIRIRPADLMDLFEKIYRMTGKAGLLALCDRLRRESLNWGRILRTFSIKRPMNKIASWLETRAGMDREGDQLDGIYTRQYHTAHAETLADGMRSAYLNSLYSGSQDDTMGSREGWEKIQSYHGAASGGTTADETVEGDDPSVAMDAASIGAWAEAFVVQLMHRENAWAGQALDQLVSNALTACFIDGTMVPYQRVNSLETLCLVKDCYKTHTPSEQKVRALNRLLRAWASVFSSAVMTTEDGIMVNLYLQATYTFLMDGKPCRLEIARTGEHGYELKLACREQLEGEIALRVPFNSGLTVKAHGQTYTSPDEDNLISVEGPWQNGDIIEIEVRPQLKVNEGFHQGMIVYWGNQLMVVPVEDKADWAVAALGNPEVVDGKIILHAAAINDWKSVSSIPELMPVLPVIQEDAALKDVEMAPYATTGARLGIVPKGQPA
ncbi:MAG: glycoside hydrolase family 127 protein [Clostridia bacterium]|nr:glycoside hydrolase family 127 protein [Clostridia bacterium]